MVLPQPNALAGESHPKLSMTTTLESTEWNCLVARCALSITAAILPRAIAFLNCAARDISNQEGPTDLFCENLSNQVIPK